MVAERLIEKWCTGAVRGCAPRSQGFEVPAQRAKGIPGVEDAVFRALRFCFLRRQPPQD